MHQLRDDKYKNNCHLIIDANHSDIDYQVKQAVDGFGGEKKQDDSVVLTAKDRTLFHHKTHEAVEVTLQQAVCLKHLVRGLTAKEAAREMGISHRTVEAHLSELKNKLGCDSEKELIALYHNVV